jgi:hypothetical protein
MEAKAIVGDTLTIKSRPSLLSLAKTIVERMRRDYRHGEAQAKLEMTQAKEKEPLNLVRGLFG